VLVTLCKPQEQSLHFYAAAGDGQGVESLGAEITQPLHQNIGLMKGFALRDFV